MDNLQKLIKILSELRTTSLSMSQNDFDENFCKRLMNNYDILFLGKNLNIIYTNELFCTLPKKFDCEIDKQTFNSLIPEACKALNMKCTPEYSLKNSNEVITYSITLY